MRDETQALSQLEDYFDRLWPICRSITGDGFRESLSILSEIIPFEITETPSGTQAFDWTVPDEWNIQEAYIEDEQGNRLIDFADNNLHVVSYSTPIDEWLSYEDLEDRLLTHPSLPNAIPYHTSYYKPYWGFCLTQSQKAEKFHPGSRYHVVIRSTLAPGSLTYGQCVLPATIPTDEECLIATYLCHPSMANNELSGPLTMLSLYQQLAAQPERRFNYRFYIGPETIGTITFLSQWGEHLVKHCRGGFVLSCCGVGDTLHYRNTRSGETLLDDCAKHYLSLLRDKKNQKIAFLPFLGRGSDERFYNSVGFQLPIGSLIRNVYGSYPEYHTSLDNKEYIRFDQIEASANTVFNIFREMEANRTFKTLIPYCEPQLGKRNLYFEPCAGNNAAIDSFDKVSHLLTLLYYSDGEHDLAAIAKKSGCSVQELGQIAKALEKEDILEAITQ